MYEYKMTEQRQRKKGGTKTVWETFKTKEKKLTQEHYDNMTSKETQQWFRRLGGSETVTMGYTRAGYQAIRLVSTNPDKTERAIRIFRVCGDE